MNPQNDKTITKADPLRQGEGGISASQQSDLLPPERVLLCKTLERRRGAYMSVRPRSIHGLRVTPSGRAYRYLLFCGHVRQAISDLSIIFHHKKQAGSHLYAAQAIRSISAFFACNSSCIDWAMALNSADIAAFTNSKAQNGSAMS